MKPSIGRTVHFLMDNVHFAAMITRVWSDTCVNLTVFDNGDSESNNEVMFIRTSVVLDNERQMNYTWHWPENVQQTGEVRN